MEFGVCATNTSVFNGSGLGGFPMGIMCAIEPNAFAHSGNISMNSCYLQNLCSSELGVRTHGKPK
jgi:hypothetical protein